MLMDELFIRQISIDRASVVKSMFVLSGEILGSSDSFFKHKVSVKKNHHVCL